MNISKFRSTNAFIYSRKVRTYIDDIVAELINNFFLEHTLATNPRFTWDYSIFEVEVVHAFYICVKLHDNDTSWENAMCSKIISWGDLD